jgi:hypothetical protein
MSSIQLNLAVHQTTSSKELQDRGIQSISVLPNGGLSIIYDYMVCVVVTRSMQLFFTDEYADTYKLNTSGGRHTVSYNSPKPKIVKVDFA